MDLEIAVLLKLLLIMHVFLWVSRVDDILSNNNSTGLISGGRKRHLMMLNQGSYGLYPSGNVKFRVGSSKVEIIWYFIYNSCICFPSISLLFKPGNHIFSNGERTNTVSESCSVLQNRLKGSGDGVNF